MNTCIILAGGLGTRLSKILDGKPKCLAPVGEITFLEILLKSLYKRGINNFILSLGYKSDLILSEINYNLSSKYNISYTIEKEPLQTGGAIKHCFKSFKLEESLVVNGDSLISGNIEAMLKPLAIEKSELIRMTLTHVSNRKRYGGVGVDDDNNVVRFLEKGDESPGLINAGFYKINKNCFPHDLNISFSFEREILPILASRKFIKAEIIQGAFIDIGIPNDYRELCMNLNNYV
tara:strand:+ start:2073 stop:2774 length:702 start_codon:yes stop_codon:yes gene_type:complete